MKKILPVFWLLTPVFWLLAPESWLLAPESWLLASEIMSLFKMNREYWIIGLLALFFFTGVSFPVFGEEKSVPEVEHEKKESPEYIQVVGVTDLRSKFSDGCFTLETLAEMCVERQIDVMIVMDHDRYSLEYGIFPFRNIIRKKVEQSSLLVNGARKYLNAFENMKYQYENLIAIPGVESAPFYYWSGGFLSSDLTANLWENHISIVGMENVEDYEGLPTLNSNFSTKYFGKFFLGFLFFFFSALVGAIMIFWGEYFRIGGIVILVVNLLFMINYHPFRSSPFDQYHGPQEVSPWQNTINYANERGGMTFWHHLESSSGIGKKGPINVNTPPHPEDLLLTHGYTGFQAVYEDTITVTEPGHEWDQALIQFLHGKRDHAVWGIGGNDYHCEGTSNIRLDDVKTVFLVEKKNMHAVLNAMRKGRMYSVREPQKKKFRLSLDEFTVQAKDGSHKATMGEAATLTGRPNIRVRISATDKGEHEVTLTLVRMGEKIQEFSTTTPVDYQLEDAYYEPGKATYYRLKAFIHGDNYLISNPVFALFQEEESGGSEGNGKKEGTVTSPPQEEKGPREEIKAVEPTPTSVTGAVEKSDETPPQIPASPPPQERKKGVEGKEETPLAPVAEKMEQPVPEEKKIASMEAGTVNESGEKGPEPEKIAEAAEEKQVAPPIAQDEKKAVIVTGDSVVLRSGPGKNFRKVRVAEKGERLDLLETTDIRDKENPWLKVSLNGEEPVYIWGGLASSAGGEEKKDPGSGPLMVVVISFHDVVLREGPGVDYRNLGTTRKDQRFLLLERTAVFHQGKPWLKIRDGENREAFIWEGMAQTMAMGKEEPLSLMNIQ